jgi:hypothetical protein
MKVKGMRTEIGGEEEGGRRRGCGRVKSRRARTNPRQKEGRREGGMQEIPEGGGRRE